MCFNYFIQILHIQSVKKKVSLVKIVHNFGDRPWIWQLWANFNWTRFFLNTLWQPWIWESEPQLITFELLRLLEDCLEGAGFSESAATGAWSNRKWEDIDIKIRKCDHDI